jgi:hypothetical protein
MDIINVDFIHARYVELVVDQTDLIKGIIYMDYLNIDPLDPCIKNQMFKKYKPCCMGWLSHVSTFYITTLFYNRPHSKVNKSTRVKVAVIISLPV